MKFERNKHFEVHRISNHFTFIKCLRKCLFYILYSLRKKSNVIKINKQIRLLHKNILFR